MNQILGYLDMIAEFNDTQETAMKLPTIKPNSIELFAGSGGMALGIEKAGFNTRALVESDSYCCETLRTNKSKFFPNAQIFESKIENISPTQILECIGLPSNEITLISGGPPCQGFSIAKISKGGRHLDDPRNGLFRHFVKFVEYIHPKAFLMENVPGLKTMEKGSVLKSILTAWEDIGYKVHFRVLNAADYGVPQRRRRLIIVGFSDSNHFDFPSRTYSAEPNNPDGLLPYVTIGETFSHLTREMPNQELPRHTKAKIARLAVIKPGSAWKGWHYRDQLYQPSRTVTGHCRDDWVHPVEPRTGTVRELAALQSFPNDYEFKGPIMGLNFVKYNFQYRQVGNAVPVLFAKAIGESILNALNIEITPLECDPKIELGTAISNIQAY